MQFVVKDIKKVEVKFPDGKVYDVRMPKVKDQRALAKATDSSQSSSTDQIDSMVKWLDGLGLPAEATEELTLDDMIALTECLMGTQKKT